MKNYLYSLLFLLLPAGIYAQQSNPIVYVGETGSFEYEIHWRDGSVYIGSVKDFDRKKGSAIREGFGRMDYSGDNAIHVGYWVNDKKEGKGVSITRQRGATLGIWQNDTVIPSTRRRIVDTTLLQNFIKEGRKWIRDHFFTAEEALTLSANNQGFDELAVSTLPHRSVKFKNGIPSSMRFYNTKKVPLYAYRNIYLDTAYTDRNPMILTKFNTDCPAYRLIEVLVGEIITWNIYLATIDQKGFVIDMLQTAICFDNNIFLKKYYINTGLGITVTELRNLKSPYKYMRNIKVLEAEMVEQYYKINAEGHFIKTGEKNSGPERYTREQLLAF